MIDPDVPLSPTDPVGVRDQAATPSSRWVYVVDDDSMVRRSLSFALSTAGFQVRAFVCGQDFLEEAHALVPGCVLLDVRMPGLDGIALLDALGDQSRRFAVVTMTGHGDVDTAVKAMKRGARDFLEKPFTDAALLASLDALFLRLPALVQADAERRQAVEMIARLTPREHDLLRGLVAGLSNKAVASRLEVSVRTVEMHRGSLMGRLAVKSVADAVRIAMLADVEPL